MALWCPCMSQESESRQKFIYFSVLHSFLHPGAPGAARRRAPRASDGGWRHCRRSSAEQTCREGGFSETPQTLNQSLWRWLLMPLQALIDLTNVP